MTKNGRPPRNVFSPYQVVKVLPNKPVKFVCQSRQWETVVTHWYGNHSVRCDGTDNCGLCLDRNAQVWKAYVLGCGAGGGPTAIFQLTPLAAYMLDETSLQDRGLLGAIIVLNRKGNRPNSPLEASIRGWTDTYVEKPFEQLERVVKVLYKQYADIRNSDS